MATKTRPKQRTQPRDANGRFVRRSTRATGSATRTSTRRKGTAASAATASPAAADGMARRVAPIALAVPVVLGAGAAIVATVQRARSGRG